MHHVAGTGRDPAEDPSQSWRQNTVLDSGKLGRLLGWVLGSAEPGTCEWARLGLCKCWQCRPGAGSAGQVPTRFRSVPARFSANFSLGAGPARFPLGAGLVPVNSVSNHHGVPRTPMASCLNCRAPATTADLSSVSMREPRAASPKNQSALYND